MPFRNIVRYRFHRGREETQDVHLHPTSPHEAFDNGTPETGHLRPNRQLTCCGPKWWAQAKRFVSELARLPPRQWRRALLLQGRARHGSWETLLSSCPTPQDRCPPMTLVARALVRRRFGIADIITINLLLPHLHKGAGSQVINGFPNVLDSGKCVAPDRSLAPLFALLFALIGGTH